MPAALHLSRYPAVARPLALGLPELLEPLQVLLQPQFTQFTRSSDGRSSHFGNLRTVTKTSQAVKQMH